jgi:chemotaxis signal transduction protein
MTRKTKQGVDWEQARQRLARAARVLQDHKLDPERIETAYRERAVALARPPEATSRVAERRVIVFRLGSDAYAASLSAIDRVVSNPECTPLPGPGGNWAGVMVFGGDILPALHLTRALGLSESESGVVFALKLRRAGFDCGVLVGEVLEIRSFPESELRPFSGRLRCVEGVAPDDAIVLDLASLVAEELLP